jgi:hypothetical protein
MKLSILRAYYCYLFTVLLENFGEVFLPLTGLRCRCFSSVVQICYSHGLLGMTIVVKAPFYFLSDHKQLKIPWTCRPLTPLFSTILQEHKSLCKWIQYNTILVLWKKLFPRFFGIFSDCSRALPSCLVSCFPVHPLQTNQSTFCLVAFSGPSISSQLSLTNNSTGFHIFEALCCKWNYIVCDQIWSYVFIAVFPS